MHENINTAYSMLGLITGNSIQVDKFMFILCIVH